MWKKGTKYCLSKPEAGGNSLQGLGAFGKVGVPENTIQPNRVGEELKNL